MTALARAALAHPRLALGGWLAAVAVLWTVGAGVEDRLHRSTIDIPGSAADRAAGLARERFGEHADLVVLLEGPRPEVERQGRRLAAALDRRADVAILSPWLPGAGDALRPAPRQALLVVRVQRPLEEVSREVVPLVRDDVDRLVSEPLDAHVTGFADIAAGISASQLDAIRRAEVVAAPLLLLVLLLVFRSPVAAALPLLVGLGTTAAGRGVLDLLNGVTPLDAAALNLASMMGLALGVDYSLLLTARYLAERRAGADPAAACHRAVETAGRTILFAGVALGVAMGTAYAIAPGQLLDSSSLGLLVAVVLSVVAALTALPAAIALLGDRVERWAIGAGGEGGLTGLTLRAQRRPALAGAVVLAVLLALSAPGLALQTGPPDPRVLPDTSRERRDFEAFRAALGEGWTAPYEIVVAAGDGPVTTRRRLAALARWQDRVARDPDVATALGVRVIEARTAPLHEARAQLRRAPRALGSGLRSLDRLRVGLGRAERAARALQDGLATVAGLGGQLARGGSAASGGAERLAAGASAASAGAGQLDDALAAARDGAAALAGGLARARAGARRVGAAATRARAELRAGLPRLSALADGLERAAAVLGALREPGRLAQRSAEDALAGLRRMLPSSQIDPEYQRVYRDVATALGALSGVDPATGARVDPGYPGLDPSLARTAAGVAEAGAGVRRLRARLRELDAGLAAFERGARRLERGIASLHAGAARLRAGAGRLLGGGRDLAGGASELADGADRLAVGVAALGDGAGRLHAGLASGAERAAPFEAGLGRMRAGVVAFEARSRRLGRGVRGASELAPLLGSGYATLAAIDANRPARRAAGFALNVDRGGTATQMLVVARGEARRAGEPLRARLEREADRLALETGAEVLVGGPAATLQDFDAATRDRGWAYLLALSLVTYLVLVPVSRSLVLPLIAVALSVLAVRAAFGVLVLLFQAGSPLGGAGHIDAIMASGVLTLAFGLSIDYQVFMLARMREGWLLTGVPERAIAYALRHTARVVSGAALTMAGVFAAFALPDVASTRQLGIGLTIAVLLDATVVRLVLLPAAIRLAGPRAWELPLWLDRLLPSDGGRGAARAAGSAPSSPARPTRGDA